MIAIYFIVGILAFWFFYPYKTLSITGYDSQHPIQILNTTVHPGDVLQYKLDYCKYTDLTSTVHRDFIDGQVVPLQDIVGGLPKGCHNYSIETTTVPETINPGRYSLLIRVDYHMNPIRTITTEYQTSYFTVVAKPTSATAIINGAPVKIFIKNQVTATST